MRIPLHIELLAGQTWHPDQKYPFEYNGAWNMTLSLESNPSQRIEKPIDIEIMELEKGTAAMLLKAPEIPGRPAVDFKMLFMEKI